MNKENINHKHIAFVFSIILPGGGFFYEKRWMTGIVFAILHILISTALLFHGVKLIYYSTAGIERTYVDITILFLILFCLILNWIFNLRKITDYK